MREPEEPGPSSKSVGRKTESESPSPGRLRRKTPPEVGSPEQPQQLAFTQFYIQQSEHYAGPLPPPEVLQNYPPDVRERILDAADEYRRHNIEMDRRAFTVEEENAAAARHLERSRVSRGQWFAFVITIVALGLAAACILNGYPVAGSILFGGTLVTLVGIFITGTSPMGPRSRRDSAPPQSAEGDAEDDRQA